MAYVSIGRQVERVMSCRTMRVLGRTTHTSRHTGRKGRRLKARLRESFVWVRPNQPSTINDHNEHLPGPSHRTDTTTPHLRAVEEEEPLVERHAVAAQPAPRLDVGLLEVGLAQEAAAAPARKQALLVPATIARVITARVSSSSASSSRSGAGAGGSWEESQQRSARWSLK